MKYIQISNKMQITQGLIFRSWFALCMKSYLGLLDVFLILSIDSATSKLPVDTYSSRFMPSCFTSMSGLPFLLSSLFYQSSISSSTSLRGESSIDRPLLFFSNELVNNYSTKTRLALWFPNRMSLGAIRGSFSQTCTEFSITDSARLRRSCFSIGCSVHLVGSSEFRR